MSLAHPRNQAMSGAYIKAGEHKCLVMISGKEENIRMAKTKFEKTWAKLQSRVRSYRKCIAGGVAF